MNAPRAIRGWSTVAIVLTALAAPIAPAQTLPPEMLLLGRIRTHLEKALNRLPDYTCRETIRRFIKPAGSQEPLKPLDTLRLEVLYSGKRELYALPGERRFGEQDISGFISGGMIGNGNFALSLESVFLNFGAVLTYAGEEDISGRRTARYDFRLSPIVSGLNLTSEYKSGKAGMKGSAWVVPQTQDVVRLVWHAEEISPEVPVEEAATAVNYAPVRIGSEDVMLPKDGEFYLRAASGREDRNLFEFTECHEFTAQSSISFGADPAETEAARPVDPAKPAAASATARPLPPALPAGIEVAIALADPISEKEAVGAPIRGEVVSDVTRNRMALIPKGAVVHGRIRRMETAMLDKRTYFAVGLEFTEIESGGIRIPFHAGLVKLDRAPGAARQVQTNTEKITIPETPGIGSFFMRGDAFQLPKGFKTGWKTRAEEK